jgi:hypothetical protein
MSHNVTIGQIRRLMADGMGSLGMSRRDAHALGLVPKWFGEAGYTAGQRLANVGLTFEALKAAGLGLQSESHGVLQEDHMSPHTIRCPPGQDLKTWQAGFRESYKAQHGGRSITPVCTGKNCPTGLVPYTIPEGARAANIAAWTAELVSSLNGKADTDLFNMPNIGAAAGTGLMLGINVPGVPRPRTNAQPAGYMAFHAALTSTKSGLNTMVALLKSADDQSQIVGPLEELTDYIAALPPGLDKITSAAFDTSVIRPGVEINLVGGSQALKVAQAALRSKGIAVDATTVFTVTGPRMKEEKLIGWEYQPKDHEALPRALFALVIEGQPSPIKRVVKAAPIQTTWAAVAGNLAVLAGEEVLITDINGDKATVYFLNDDVQVDNGHELGETFEVSTANLSQPS